MRIKASDVGSSMYTYAFGAFFGIMTSFAIHFNAAGQTTKNISVNMNNEEQLWNDEELSKNNKNSSLYATISIKFTISMNN